MTVMRREPASGHATGRVALRTKQFVKVPHTLFCPRNVTFEVYFSKQNLHGVIFHVYLCRKVQIFKVNKFFYSYELKKVNRPYYC